MNQANLQFKGDLFRTKPLFRGIPKPLDFNEYNRVYYESVERLTAQFYGPHATIAQAVETMNLHGNMVYFHWFPDLYQTDKAILKSFCNPVFTPVGGNVFADYLHGLTHIRSLSSHTNLGEALAVVDNMINNKVRYQVFMDKFKNDPLDTIDIKPAELLDDLNRDKSLLDKKTIILFDIIKETWAYQRRDMDFYKRTYLEDTFKMEFPLERPSKEFIANPINELEQRMKRNVVRALYLDEKFKFYSSYKHYFSETPISLSHKEPYQLVFTTEDENILIDSLVAGISTDSTNLIVDVDKLKVDSKLIKHTIECIVKWLS